tara:strand:- start:1489 stop:2388 length:900 start_codon:yes stop_codon:yes gene_type:complete
MKKPNFIIAGFPKCGTTSLHHYLNEHPEIFMPEQKELHFFTFKILSKLKNGPKDDIVKQMQINSSEKYLSYFQNVKNEIAIGDASPSYINYPSEFSKIKEYLNDPKVIIILRDPINRAYSNYLHLKREHRETMSFKDALGVEEERIKNNYSDFWYYKFNSTYYEKIIKAKTTFSSVLILTIEELDKDPAVTMKKVYKFLGVDNSFSFKTISEKFNVGGNYKKNFVTKLFFQPSKFKNRIKRFIKPTSFLKIILMRLTSIFRIKPEKIDQNLIEQLKSYFKNDVENLKKLDVNISNWKEY